MNTSLIPPHRTSVPNFCATHRKILFIDDQESMTMFFPKTLVLILKEVAPKDTFEIITSNDVEEAKESIIKNKPDIVFSDMQIDNKGTDLPDGIKLGKFARENGVKSIAFQTDSDLIFRRTAQDGYNIMKKGEFEIIEKSNLLKKGVEDSMLPLRKFLGKLLKKL